MAPAVKCGVLNHWATNEVPRVGFLISCHFLLATHLVGVSSVESSPAKSCCLGYFTHWVLFSVLHLVTIHFCGHSCYCSFYPDHLCCLSLLMPSPHHTTATVGGSIEIVRMPSKCLTQFTRNSYSQPRRPMRNGGHEAGKNWEECGEGQAAMLRELVWMLKWLSELTTLRILRRQNSMLKLMILYKWSTFVLKALSHLFFYSYSSPE